MIEIEAGSGNVYADLGMADADEMIVKAQLAIKIGEIIRAPMEPTTSRRCSRYPSIQTV